MPDHRGRRSGPSDELPHLRHHAVPRPLAAAEQLRQVAVAYDHSGAIEAAHEAARLAYKAAFAEPVTAQEQQYIELLAGRSAARRDKIVELAEEHARHPEA
ncbi:hypothetical protein [Micromonospora sp. NPDC000018]|uniref:hypothetical protein n=1 Tax=Micromonospora sp. NPDC000018 TaxID=3154239 RepID=UPI0033280957